jgi:hypothetical protein
MKIIKQGLSKEQLAELQKKPKRFECYFCGCIFVADINEYKSDKDYIYTKYSCICPNCNAIAPEVIRPICVIGDDIL